MMTENVLDAENWKLEAEAVAKDIQNHVKCITLAEGNNHQIFFNLTTIEGNDFCVELSGNGFRVTGTKYNEKNNNSEVFYETPYSLLNELSPGFQQSFGSELVNKLNDLNKTQNL